MHAEPRWLPIEEVIQINRDEVAETGEPFFVRDMGLLEGALHRSQNRWHYDGEDDIVRLAATLLFAIADAHAFEQGNKRTALTAAVVFLYINGHQLALQDTEELGKAIEAVIDDRLEIERFIDLIRPFVVPFDLHATLEQEQKKCRSS